MNFILKFIFILFILVTNSFSQEIILYETDIEVWGTGQQIDGEFVEFSANTGTLYLNDSPIEFELIDSLYFSIPVTIREGENIIFVQVLNEGNLVSSKTISLTLGYEIKPEIFSYPTIEGQSVTLHAKVLDNPDSSIISYEWSSDPNNFVETTITSPNDTVSAISFDDQLINGEYYFNLLATTDNNDTIKARTFITVKGNEIIPFNIYNDHASWIDSAIIYEITPYNFVNPKGDLKQVQKKIPDFVRLGVNTLWIQPVYKTNYGGQGYDIINYFKVREDYGTEEELHALIKEAKNNNLRVIFDIVPNHSSIAHPYARDASENGESSHYWNYYQRETDSSPYSQHYSFYNGFINYFWDQLPNLNFNNPEVVKWISEAIRYWVEEFDIDGYRFDAVWGVNARKPQFMKDVRFALKRFKPEVMMLAEDKATWQETFDKNFDVAFDWAPGESWVSQWTWQTNYSEFGNQTIFNSPSENSRQRLLREAITNNGNGYAPNAKILRFMGNNDIPHFITHHGLERTKMAAILLFSLHGIPMIYNGQEIGVEGHPYSTEFLFFPGYSIDYNDPHNLFPFYQRIIEIRKSYKALSSDNYQELTTDNDYYTFAFRRWEGTQNLITAMNMKSTPASFTISLPIDELGLDSTSTYYLTELITGEVISGDIEALKNFTVSMDRYNSKIFLFADSVEIVTSLEEQCAVSTIPTEFSLSQNYPNPFNPTTTIEFGIPQAGNIRLNVFNILGEKVAELINGNFAAGRYSVKFNAQDLGSGIYFSQLIYDDKSISKKMSLVK